MSDHSFGCFSHKLVSSQPSMSSSFNLQCRHSILLRLYVFVIHFVSFWEQLKEMWPFPTASLKVPQYNCIFHSLNPSSSFLSQMQSLSCRGVHPWPRLGQRCSECYLFLFIYRLTDFMGYLIIYLFISQSLICIFIFLETLQLL